jgi:L-glyceraldehyde 3-phosphate reductase
VLCGASRPEQIIDNCQALQNLEFSQDELAAIDTLLNQLKLPHSLWAKEKE